MDVIEQRFARPRLVAFEHDGQHDLVATEAHRHCVAERSVLAVPLVNCALNSAARDDDGEIAVRVRPAVVDRLEVVEVGRGPNDAQIARSLVAEQLKQTAEERLPLEQRERVVQRHLKGLSLRVRLLDGLPRQRCQLALVGALQFLVLQCQLAAVATDGLELVRGG